MGVSKKGGLNMDPKRENLVRGTFQKGTPTAWKGLAIAEA